MVDVKTGLNDGDIAHLAEISSNRQMADTLGRVAGVLSRQTEKLENLTDKIALMHTDIEVMKATKIETDRIREIAESNRTRIEAIELFHAKQAGTSNALTGLREWGPWVFAILAFLWGLLQHGVKLPA